MTKSGFDAEFDVVVVGAGSAGCVLSARLTENPDITLCAIEAGGRDRNPWIHIPMGFGKLVPNPNVNWGYATEPEPGLGGRSIVWPRGKVLGGSGSINGLVFLRGAPSDYDEWQRLGAQGWSYRDVLPYFKRMEHCVDGANTWRGTGGPMTVSQIKRPSTVARAFVEACERLQYQRNPDFNGERIDGIGFAPLNVHNGWRRSTAVGYLKPNLKRRNLELMTRTHVRRILFEGRRAVGVEVERNGQIQRIGARRELVLSGGSINSPVLLLASGVGPAGELTAQGIDVKLDLPGVGKNLQDHYQSSFAFKTHLPGTLNETILSPVKSAKLALQWLLTGSGQMAVGATEATLFAKSNPSEPVPDIQYQVLNYSSDGIVKGLHRWPGFSFIFSVCRPKSRGEITLRDKEGRLPPRIRRQLPDPPRRRQDHGGGVSHRQPDCGDRSVPFARQRTVAAGARGEKRRADRGLCPQGRLDRLSSVRNLPDGRAERRGGRQPAACSRHRRVAGSRRFRDAGDAIAEHSSRHNYGRGEGFGYHRNSLGELNRMDMPAPFTLAFLVSRRYIWRTINGRADVDFNKPIGSDTGIGGAVFGRANSPCPNRPGVILDPRLAFRLRRQFNRRPEPEHLRQLSEL